MRARHSDDCPTLGKVSRRASRTVAVIRSAVIEPPCLPYSFAPLAVIMTAADHLRSREARRLGPTAAASDLSLGSGDPGLRHQLFAVAPVIDDVDAIDATPDVLGSMIKDDHLQS